MSKLLILLIGTVGIATLTVMLCAPRRFDDEDDNLDEMYRYHIW